MTMGWVDRIAAVLVTVLGVAHLAVGHAVFFAPTERRVWFMSAGLLAVLIGLVNLACAGRSAVSRTAIAAALFGALSILLIGALLTVATPGSTTSPQAIALLGFGVVLAFARGAQLLRYKAHAGGGA